MGDYHSLKINHYNKKTDNYITTSGHLVLNSTVKTGGVTGCTTSEGYSEALYSCYKTFKEGKRYIV